MAGVWWRQQQLQLGSAGRLCCEQQQADGGLPSLCGSCLGRSGVALSAGAAAAEVLSMAADQAAAAAGCLLGAPKIGAGASAYAELGWAAGRGGVVYGVLHGVRAAGSQPCLPPLRPVSAAHQPTCAQHGDFVAVRDTVEGVLGLLAAVVTWGCF